MTLTTIDDARTYFSNLSGAEGLADGDDALHRARCEALARRLWEPGMTVEQLDDLLEDRGIDITSLAEDLVPGASEDGGLYAEELSGGWSVVDPDGGRWWPHEDAAEEIASSGDPAATAVAMCEATPMRGEWRD